MLYRRASAALSLMPMAIVLAVSSASAASLRDVQGTAFVNSGDGFRQVAEPFELRTGDSVMVGAAGRALIRYEGGCRVWVPVGKVVVVEAEENCVCGDAYRATVQKTGVSSASLRSITGTVQVDNGQGFANVNQHVWLKTGDRVWTRGNGRAVIHYQDGCTVDVAEDCEVVVRSESPCACGFVDAAQSATIGSNVGGVSLPAALAATIAGVGASSIGQNVFGSGGSGSGGNPRPASE